ncbi:hypothetical protein GGI07_002190 [Coemansia sp. Benny D115]|nr:hypothetical protein GGI07_002190 [Coemansia sp. Benny D115]
MSMTTQHPTAMGHSTVQVEEAQAVAIEKALAAMNKQTNGSSTRVSNMKNNAAPGEVARLTQALQAELGSQARMHEHLANRIKIEVVQVLDAFMTKDAWCVARDIESKIHKLASAMQAQHDQIPKLSARTVAKSTKASQQAKQKLEQASQTLVQLQQSWQKDIAALVADFETADVARVELIRESLLRFEHYRTEFHKASINGATPVKDLAKTSSARARIIDVLRGDIEGTQPPQQQNQQQSHQHNPRSVSHTTSMESSVAGSSSQHRSDHTSSHHDAASSMAATEGEERGKGLFKLNLFRSKTKRQHPHQQTGSDSHSASTSMHSRSRSSLAPSHGANASGAPPSIATAHARDHRADSDAFSPASSFDAGAQSNPALQFRGRTSTFASMQSAATRDSSSTNAAVAAGSVREQQQQQQQPPVLLQTSTIHSQSAGGADFAEWVFAEGSQEAIAPPPVDASVGSIVHIASTCLPPISEATDNAEPVGEAKSKTETETETETKAPNPESGSSTSVTGPAKEDTSHLFADFDQVKFDDSGFAMHAAAGTEPSAVDLDSAFSIPSRNTQTPSESVAPQSGSTAAAANAFDVSAPKPDPVFDFESAFPSKSPLPAAKSVHQRSASLANNNNSSSSCSPAAADTTAIQDERPAKEKSTENTNGETESSGDDDDDDELNDQSFRVKFSIRERAIKDNPDESKAALSRVTTLLRAAPSVSRGRRRDVRTMYVPNSLPISSASTEAAGSSGTAADPLWTPRTPLTPRSSAIASAAFDDAFNRPRTPLTPMPQGASDEIRHHPLAHEVSTVDEKAKKDVKTGESGDAGVSGDVDDDKVLLAHVAQLRSSDAEENDAIPVATATTLDVPAAVEESTVIDTMETPIDGVTTAPVAENAADDNDKNDKKDVLAEVQAAEERQDDASAQAESSTVAQDPVESKDDTNTEVPNDHADRPAPSSETLPALHKTDSALRRRAPPPPPSVRSRSLRHQTLAASGEAAASAQAAASSETATAVQPRDGLDDAQVVPEVETAAENTADGESHQISRSAAPAPPAPRGRRQQQHGPMATAGPPAITMHVRETLDFTFERHSADNDDDTLDAADPVTINHIVTGEINMHIASAINPLELAPLRISVQRPNQVSGQLQLVANPSVVVADTSLTAALNDGREWFRFVRPNLFAQLSGDKGTDVVVFKYQATGAGNFSIMPMDVIAASTCEPGLCALMIFCEPRPSGVFSGDTILAPAVLLNIDGQITSQVAKPAAMWYRERNALLWRLEDMKVPVPADTEEATKAAVHELSRTLAVKARGEGSPVPVSIALKFEARATRVVSVGVTIARVAAAGTATSGGSALHPPVVPLIDSPASCTVRSGKCVYKSTSITPHAPVSHAEPESQENSGNRGDDEESESDDGDQASSSHESNGDNAERPARSRSGSESSEAWSHDGEANKATERNGD